MSPRPLILRRLLAFGGIALALMASLQESHALCAIATCTAETRNEKAHPQHTASQCSCRRGTDDASAQTGFAAYKPAKNGQPCGSPCYGWRACPRVVPRNVAQLLQTPATSLIVECLPDTGAIKAQLAAVDTRTSGMRHLIANSSGSTCALLCRFLT
jgi:hypothetical protein